MSSQVAAELPFYTDDGTFLGYAGYAAGLVLELTQAQESGPPLPQNLDGRLFEQRVMTQDGEVLLTITGVNRTLGRVAFNLTSEQSAALLPAEAVALDLVHIVGEVTAEGLTPLLTAPFALRRTRPGLGAVVLKLEPVEGTVLMRFAGAPPLTLLQELIAGGDLPEGATHEDMIEFLQHGLSDDQAAALAAVQGQQATSVAAVVAAGATQAAAVNAAGAAKLDAIQDLSTAALQSVADREGQALVLIAEQEAVSIQAVEGVGAAQAAALASAGGDQVDAVEAAGTTQVGGVQAAGATQLAAVNAAGGDQVEAVETAGAAQVGTVNAAGATQLAAVNTAGGDQVDAVEAAGTEQAAAVAGVGAAALADIADRETQALDAIANAEAGELAPIIAEGSTQVALVTAEGDDQVVRVGEAGTTAAASVATAHAAQFYVDTAAGLAAVAEGGYFYVKTGNDVVLYRDVAGVAVEQFRWQPASAYEIVSTPLPLGQVDATIDSAGRLGPAMLDDGRLTAADTVFRKVNGIADLKLQTTVSTALTNYWQRPTVKPHFDITVLLIWHQSNGEGGTSNYPLIDTAAVPGVIMMDAIRNRFLAPGARFQNGFQPAAEVLELVGGVWYGQTGWKKAGAMVMKRWEEVCGQPWASHRSYVLPLCIGESGNTLAEIEVGTAAFQLGLDTCAAMVAETQDPTSPWYGLSIGIGGVIGCWGKRGYDDNLSMATAKAQQLTYTGHIDQHFAPVFSQRVDSYRHALLITSGHVPGSKRPNTIAESQLQICEENDRFDDLNPQGAYQLENSSTHHTPREADDFGAMAGLWLWETHFCKRKWASFIPVISRVSSKVIKVSVPDLAPNHYLGVEITGAPGLKVMRANYGFEVYDQAAPTVALTQLRAPRIVGPDIFIELAADPGGASLDLRYSAGNIHGSIVQIPLLPELEVTIPINGVSTPIRRRMVVFDRPVPAV